MEATSSWKEIQSKKYNRPYWFNEKTGESKWDCPFQYSQQPKIGFVCEDQKTDELELKRKGVITDILSKTDNVTTPICPADLQHKRDFLFKGLETSRRLGLVIDSVAAFSVTESKSADKMTRVIISACDLRSPESITILDGMACVGGNTISFASSFHKVIANELDPKRFEMLNHNARTIMKLDNIEFRNESIIELVSAVNFDILFLDPEWGGPSYKSKRNLRLTISEVALETFVLDIFRSKPSVIMIALKLPVNYDNVYIKNLSHNNNLLYSFFDNFEKMTLTILKRS